MSPNKVKRTKRIKAIKRPAATGPRPTAAMVVLLVGMMLLSTSLALPWANLKVDTKLGPIPVSLDAQVSEYGVSYTADLSGTQGLIQGTGNINKKITDKKVFITGLGSFQELIGFIKGSSKYRNYTTEIFTTPPNNAHIVVETYAATIPWWPVGVSQEVKVTVSMSEPPQNISHVNIKRVWIELHQTVNGQDRHKDLWETSPTSDKLTNMGDSISYSSKVVVNSDLGNFSIVGMAQLEVIDKGGTSGSGNGHEIKATPKMINLWTISNSRTARIAMLLMAMPLTVLSIVMLLASAIASYAKSRWAWKLAAIAAILGLLSVAFYYLGVGALIELTGYGKWFSWSPTGPALAAFGGSLGLLGCILLFINDRKQRPTKVVSDHPEEEDIIEEQVKERTKKTVRGPKPPVEERSDESEE
jgi:hypothetical protein